MSIFKDTFIPAVQKQLDSRQKAVKKRSPQAIQYLNTRNAWIRMTSSVNVNQSSALANAYKLQGGTLSGNTPRAGVGNTSNTAYSAINPGGTANARGIRPMPGIVDITIRSKSAYGSMREVVVNFQCWDITQLEDLELLYMRPGYTALVEWGWLPYLVTEDSVQNNIQPYDIIDEITPKEKIWANLFNKSKATGGNYDAMFGYVKNYSWAARPDGGYDCSTTIISIGEVIESLKVNYAPLNLTLSANSKGLTGINVTQAVIDRYKKNILAGLFAELYEVVKSFNNSADENGNTFSYQGNLKTTDLKFFIKKLEIKDSTDLDPNKQVGYESNKNQIYIKLSSLVNLLNEKVILSDKQNDTPLIKLSTKGRTYDKPTSKNNTPPPEEDLLCLAHPLQISVDPTICLIGNSSWSNVQKPNSIPPTTLSDVTIVGNTYDNVIKDIIKAHDAKNETALINLIKPYSNDINKLSQLNKEFQLNNPTLTYKESKNARTFETIVEVTTLYDYIDDVLEDNEIAGYEIADALGIKESTKNNFTGAVLDLTNFFRELVGAPAITSPDKKTEELIKAERKIANAKYNAIKKDEWTPATELIKTKRESKLKNAQNVANGIAGSQYLKNLDSFFYKDSTSELGIIGNIYVNLQYLYGLSLDNNLESQDKKEKQEIAIYDFIKSILSSVSNVTGNINNFDIHIDPVDNVCRIIDINYVDEEQKDKVFNNAFILQMHNTESTVRNYKLESQIFPDQSTTIAIGAQVQGGALGTDSNTMSGFNRNIEDRIIPRKKDPNVDQKTTEAETRKQEIESLKTNLSTIYSFFGNTTTSYIFWSNAAYDVNSSGQYAGALRDLIKGFQSLTKSKSKYSAIIPTKLSLEMDGIGGLVIGHIFKIPSNLLPKGYKGDGGIGSKLGYIITSIGHKISGNDWTTSIDAQTIILDDPKEGETVDYPYLLQNTTLSLTTGGTPEISGGDTTNVVTGGTISGTFKPLASLTASTQNIIKTQNNDLILVREGSTSNRTIGTMWYKGNVIGYTVEDALRTKKIKSKTAIPKGTYNVELDITGKPNLYKNYVKFPNATGKFKSPGVFPRVGNTNTAPKVDGKGSVTLINENLRFDGIRIHSGDSENSSAGCIIYSSKRNSNGTVAFDQNHNAVLTKLIYANKINKIVVINEF
jgi:hypothetical protein